MSSALKTLKDYFWPAEKNNPPEGTLALQAALGAKVIRANGDVEERGVVSRRLVTNAFVAYLVDSFQNSTSSPLDVFIYHDAGTGTTTEAAAQTTLATAWGGSRATGTKTEGASSNIYKSVGTVTFTSAHAVTEHGLFSAAAAGTLLDRSSFAAINVASNDSIEFTYQLTCSAGG